MTSPQLKSKIEYERSKCLHKGEYGALYQISVHQNKSNYALKELNFGNLNETEKKNAFSQAKIENDLLRNKLPNVLKGFGSNYDETNEVFEYSMQLMKMNLFQLVKSKNGLGFKEFLPLYAQIIRGIYYIRIFL